MLMLFLGLLAPTARAEDFWMQLANALTFLGWDIQANKHVLRDGWQLNAARQFNSQSFDASTRDLFLNGTMVFQAATAKRFIPTLDIRANSAGANLRNVYTTNTGFQDFFMDNTTNYNFAFNINLLGFYDLDLSMTNTGTYGADGYFLVDDGSTDFNIGPYSLSGNIWLDAINVFTNPLGLPTLSNLLNGRATKEWNNEEGPTSTVGKRWLVDGKELDELSEEERQQFEQDMEALEALREQFVLIALSEIEQRPVVRLFSILSEAESPSDVDVAALQELLADLIASLPGPGEWDLASLFVTPVILPIDEYVPADFDATQAGTESAVPEPTSLLLVSGGLLLGWRRRRAA
jgi:hypothetical protein